MLSCLIARRDHDPALADVTADRTCFNCTFALFLSAAVRLPVVHHSWVDPTAVLTTSTAHTLLTPRCNIAPSPSWHFYWTKLIRRVVDTKNYRE